MRSGRTEQLWNPGFARRVRRAGDVRLVGSVRQTGQSGLCIWLGLWMASMFLSHPYPVVATRDPFRCVRLRQSD